MIPVPPSTMLLRVLTLVVVGHLLLVFNGAAAQTSSVVCPPSYNWAENSHAQNPCVIAAYLLRPCGTSLVDVPVLPLNQHYDPGDSSDCNCNTVVYSLVSACADCQGRLFDTWTKWSQNCTSVYRAVYPHPIPTGTAVPAWAYLDVVTANDFDPNAALNDINAAESTAVLPTTSTSTSHTTSSTSSAPSSTNSGKSSKLNIGVIAGASVAGLVVIGLCITGVVWLFVRNRRQSQSASTYRANIGGLDRITPMSPPPTNATRPPLDEPSYNSYPAPTQPMPKLYDPSDPSTFPTNDMIGPPSTIGYTPPPQLYTPPPQSGYSVSPPPTSVYSTQPPMSYTSSTQMRPLV